MKRMVNCRRIGFVLVVGLLLAGCGKEETPAEEEGKSQLPAGAESKSQLPADEIVRTESCEPQDQHLVFSGGPIPIRLEKAYSFTFRQKEPVIREIVRKTEFYADGKPTNRNGGLACSATLLAPLTISGQVEFLYEFIASQGDPSPGWGWKSREILTQGPGNGGVTSTREFAPSKFPVSDRPYGLFVETPKDAKLGEEIFLGAIIFQKGRAAHQPKMETASWSEIEKVVQSAPRAIVFSFLLRPHDPKRYEKYRQKRPTTKPTKAQ